MENRSTPVTFWVGIFLVVVTGTVIANLVSAWILGAWISNRVDEAFGASIEEPIDGGQEDADDFESGDAEACALVMNEGFSLPTVQEAWSLADSGSDVEAALEEWNVTPSDEQRAVIERECSQFGG